MPCWHSTRHSKVASIADETLQALADLDDRQLRDIGLARDDYKSYCALGDD